MLKWWKVVATVPPMVCSAVPVKVTSLPLATKPPLLVQLPVRKTLFCKVTPLTLANTTWWNVQVPLGQKIPCTTLPSKYTV